MNVLDTILISFLTTFGTAAIGVFVYYLRGLIKDKSQSKVKLIENKRKSFQRLLDEHSEIFLGSFHKKSLDEWSKDFSEMRKNILLWASDDVLYEYAQFVVEQYEQDDIKEYELHFAKAILAFRKEIGYKNKKNKISAEQVVCVFRTAKGNL